MKHHKPPPRRLPSVYQITLSVFAGLVMAWVIGFFLFFGLVALQPRENLTQTSDLAVVLTGGTGRVEEGFRLILDKRAKALLISGVHPNTRLQDLVTLAGVSVSDKDKLLHHCCITIGHVAETTETNARETADWLADKPDIHTIRIVTSNYHLPRAWILFRRAMPDRDFSAWPVAGNPPTSPTFWRNVLSEYSKTLMTWLS